MIIKAIFASTLHKPRVLLQAFGRKSFATVHSVQTMVDASRCWDRARNEIGTKSRKERWARRAPGVLPLDRVSSKMQWHVK